MYYGECGNGEWTFFSYMEKISMNKKNTFKGTATPVGRCELRLTLFMEANRW